MTKTETAMLYTSISPEEVKFNMKITRPKGDFKCILQWYIPTGFKPVHTRKIIQTATDVREFPLYFLFNCDGEPAILYKRQKVNIKPLAPPPEPVKYIFAFHRQLPKATWAEEIYVYHSEDCHNTLNPMCVLFYRPLAPILNMNEKRAFCVWYSHTPTAQEVPFTVGVSLTTFLRFNPDFTLYLYTNVPFTGLPEGIVLIPITKDDIPFHDGYPAHFADYMRLKALYQFGGMYFDCHDTITLKSFLELYNMYPDKLMWSSCHQKETDFATGVLICRTPGNSVMKHIINSFHTLYQPHNYSYNMEISTRSGIFSFPDQQMIDSVYWFPFRMLCVPRTKVELDPRTVQIHMYAGNTNTGIHPAYSFYP